MARVDLATRSDLSSYVPITQAAKIVADEKAGTLMIQVGENRWAVLSGVTFTSVAPASVAPAAGAGSAMPVAVPQAWSLDFRTMADSTGIGAFPVGQTGAAPAVTNPRAAAVFWGVKNGGVFKGADRDGNSESVSVLWDFTERVGRYTFVVQRNCTVRIRGGAISIGETSIDFSDGRRSVPFIHLGETVTVTVLEQPDGTLVVSAGEPITFPREQLGVNAPTYRAGFFSSLYGGGNSRVAYSISKEPLT